MARGVIGALCLIAGIIVAGDYLWWLGLVFVAAGLFAIFEAIAAGASCAPAASKPKSDRAKFILRALIFRWE